MDFIKSRKTSIRKIVAAVYFMVTFTLYLHNIK